MRDAVRVYGLRYTLIVPAGIAARGALVAFFAVHAGWIAALVGAINLGPLMVGYVVASVVAFDTWRGNDGPPGSWNGRRRPCASCETWLGTWRHGCTACGAAILSESSEMSAANNSTTR